MMHNIRVKGFLILCLYTLLSHIYFVLRYSGRWIEGDTSRMIKYAQYVQDQATILPSGLIYPNGPGHSTILVMLSHLTKFQINVLQQYIMPLVGILPVPVAYFVFYELLRSKKLALLSAFLLALQPDFLFTSSRGSHEKFTYTLLLLSMLFLSRSFTTTKNPREFTKNVLLFYITVVGFISYNFFFASTYIFAVTVAFIMGFIISQIPSIMVSFKRLIFTSATSSVFFFSYMFYIYTPSRHLLQVFDTLADKVGAVALATEQHVTPQYDYIFSWWVSFKIWAFLTLFNWVIALLSFSMWLYLIYRFFRKKESLSRSIQLLLMFYTAFSIQLLLTIFGDRFGVFNNIELRIFPVLMFFAIPLAAMAFKKIFYVSISSKKKKDTFKAVFILLILIFSLNSMLKATNDPMVSNKWLFYTVQEKNSLFWVEDNLKGHPVWAGLDERLKTVHVTYSTLEGHQEITFTRIENADFWFVSNMVLTRAKSIRFPLPYIKNSPVIYDSGEVKVYRITGKY